MEKKSPLRGEMDGRKKRRMKEKTKKVVILLAIIAAPLGLRAYLYTGALGSYVSADGQRALRLRWHVTCDEANKTFYSANGRLYHRDTGAEVGCFHYWDAKE